ncbi:MAG: ABC transporter ATP-binding protein, partial [Clostridia bacterium]|nr:ABC transporter ATP-binding protein [Clostridia bacterium]
QRYALFPHMNVADNIAFGLHAEKYPREAIRDRVREMLQLVDMEGFEKRGVHQLSGGQQQRVAIARALIKRPQVLLLDEPLAALDKKMRQGMQRELKAMQQHLGITFVFVTHDQEEALTMSDTVAVIRGGVIQHIGTPMEVYNEPKNRFVAQFIGESNMLPGAIPRDCEALFGGGAFECVDKGFRPNEVVDVVIRPEDIYIVDSEHGTVTGVVESITFMGIHNEMRIRGADGYVWRVFDTGSRPVGEEVGLRIRPDDIHLMRLPSEEVVQAVAEAEAEDAEDVEEMES